MLDYPHEHKAMQLRITHLLKNLGYAEEGGRRAALNCLYLVVLHFPEVELSTKWGSLIFAATAARLPQDPCLRPHIWVGITVSPSAHNYQLYYKVASSNNNLRPFY
ncbi:utp20 [Symbiodinium sp. KB8]|nr:utp20 [Symbiodinium sp. KB8]